jgi:hypothetical protein
MTETQHILNNQAVILAALASLMSDNRMSDILIKQAKTIEKYFQEVAAAEQPEIDK